MRKRFPFLQRDDLLDAEESAGSKITGLEQRGQELQAFIQQLSVDLQNVSWGIGLLLLQAGGMSLPLTDLALSLVMA